MSPKISFRVVSHLSFLPQILFELRCVIFYCTHVTEGVTVHLKKYYIDKDFDSLNSIVHYPCGSLLPQPCCSAAVQSICRQSHATPWQPIQNNSTTKMNEMCGARPTGSFLASSQSVTELMTSAIFFHHVDVVFKFNLWIVLQ